jgi:hypothetical protein
MGTKPLKASLGMCVRDVSAVPLTLTAWEKHRVGLRLMTGEQEN